MADDEGEDEELDAIWNPAQPNTSPRPKNTLELVVANGKESYSAFVAQDRVESFVVRCANGHRYRFFTHRLNGVEVHPHATTLTIKTNDGVIQIYGRGLEAIDDALAMHTCRAITEFSPALHLPPTDRAAPFIERIDVILPRPPEKPQRVAKAEKTPEEA